MQQLYEKVDVILYRVFIQLLLVVCSILSFAAFTSQILFDATGTFPVKEEKLYSKSNKERIYERIGRHKFQCPATLKEEKSYSSC